MFTAALSITIIRKAKVLGVIERRGDAIFQDFEKVETATSEEDISQRRENV